MDGTTENLSGQGIKDINDIWDMITETADYVTTLDLSNNYLRDFNIEVNFLSLKVLLLDNNMISSLGMFPIIPSLENLGVNNNNFSNLADFISSLQEKFPSIVSVNTLRNPMNPGIDKGNAYKDYKISFRTINTLRLVDGMDINDTTTIDYIEKNNQAPQQEKKSLMNFFKNTNPSSKNNPLGDGSDYTGSSTRSNMYNQVVQPKKQEQGFIDPNNQPKRLMFTIDESEEIDGSVFVDSLRRPPSIQYNEKILKKSDNLTKFNRKNHSEGNKHILNSDL